MMMMMMIMMMMRIQSLVFQLSRLARRLDSGNDNLQL